LFAAAGCCCYFLCLLKTDKQKETNGETTTITNVVALEYWGVVEGLALI